MSSEILFEINGTEMARIETGPKFGVGTPDPAYTVDVFGDVRGTNLYATNTVLAARVGIQQSTPIYDLDVGGDIRATGQIRAEANDQMYFQGGDDAALWDINEQNTIGIYGVQDSAQGQIQLGSGGPRLWGKGDSLGINTPSNPTKPLSVHAASGTVCEMGNTEGNGSLLCLVAGADFAAGFGTATNHDLRFLINTQEKARLTTSGKLGLMHNNPPHTLTVQGSSVTFGLGDFSGSGTRVVLSTTGNSVRLDSPSDNDVCFSRMATDCITLRSLGRVKINNRLGIGCTPNTDCKLQIEFSTESLEFMDAGSVFGCNWTDYIKVEVGGSVGYIRVYSSPLC